MNRFSEFASEESQFEGKKISIDELANKEVVVLDFNVRDSKFARSNCDKCATIQIEIDGLKRVCFTGSSVLIRQCEKYKDNMPFSAQIKKIDKYYTFV